MFLADRYIKGECPKLRREGPVRRHLRGLRRGLFADRAEEPVLDALRRAAGAEDLGALLLQAVRPALRRVPARMAAGAGRLQPQVVNKVREWLDGEGDKALGDWDITRDAPYFGIRDPGHRRGQVLLRLAGRADRLPAPLKNYCANERASTSTHFLADPDDRADPLHRQGHHLLPHAVLAGDAEVRRRAVQGAGPRLRARLHHRLAARR